MNTSEEHSNVFWRKRLLQHGHTGWSDPFIYAYDQLERMSLIRSAVGKCKIEHGVAIDFGCGTGDFSRMLLEMGFAVFGYDPFVRARIGSAKFIYARSYQELSCGNQTADLVLSVTALDHILDEDGLRDALDVIRARLKPSGSFYMLEYALEAEADRKRYGMINSYQAFRTLAEWTRLLSAHSLRVLDVESIPHPEIGPSRGYVAYSRTSVVRVGRRCSSVLSLVKPWRDAVLKKLAQRFILKHPVELQTIHATPLKLIRCSIE